MLNRKGITPIIAVVLLLMMTVAAAGLAYQFVIGTQTDIQEGLKGQVQQQQVESQAKIQIDSVYKAGLNDLAIVVRNTGTYNYSTGTTPELTVYIDGAPTTVTYSATSLAPKGTVTITAAGKWPSSTGTSANIRIVPQIGNAVSYTCTNDGKTFC